MAKSSMRSAGIRKHHRRIEHQNMIDRKAFHQPKFKQKEHITLHDVITLSVLARVWGGMKASIVDFFNSFFTPPSINLDLRHSMDLGEKQKRAAGANTLRALWPALGKMVSTRDGKRV